MTMIPSSIRVLAGLCLTALVLSVAPVHADQKALRIWINDDQAHKGLVKVGEKFTKDTGVAVVIEHPQDVASKLQPAVASGTSPDVILCAHDSLERWVAAGYIEAVAPKPKFRSQFDEIGWRAFSISGTTYGYPLSFEAIGLVYNKAMVSLPPKTFDEIFALDKQLQKNGKHAILWAHSDPYYSFPLLAANGGYAFGQNASGGYVATDVGVNNGGAVTGAEMIAKLIESGVVPRHADYGATEAAMNKGDVAMTIAGPPAWRNLKQAKISFGVAPLPAINGKPAKAFIRAQGAMISRASANKQLAIEFLENYLLTLDGLKTLDADVTLGVTAHKEFYKTRAADPLLSGTMRNIQSGVIIPSLPAMNKFWAAMGSALSDIAQSRKKPKEALDGAAARIKAP